MYSTMKCLTFLLLSSLAAFVSADDDSGENLFFFVPLAQTSSEPSPRHGGSYPSQSPFGYPGGFSGGYPGKQPYGQGKRPYNPYRPSSYYPSNSIVHFPNRHKNRPGYGQNIHRPGYQKYPKYPQQIGGYPGQVGGYPGKIGGYPGRPGAYPGQTAVYPNQIGSYPVQSGIYPVKNYPQGYHQQRPHGINQGAQIGHAIGSLIGGVLSPIGYGRNRGRPVIGVVQKPGRRRYGYGYSPYLVLLR